VSLNLKIKDLWVNNRTTNNHFRSLTMPKGEGLTKLYQLSSDLADIVGKVGVKLGAITIYQSKLSDFTEL